MDEFQKQAGILCVEAFDPKPSIFLLFTQFYYLGAACGPIHNVERSSTVRVDRRPWRLAYGGPATSQHPAACNNAGEHSSQQGDGQGPRSPSCRSSLPAWASTSPSSVGRSRRRPTQLRGSSGRHLLHCRRHPASGWPTPTTEHAAQRIGSTVLACARAVAVFLRRHNRNLGVVGPYSFFAMCAQTFNITIYI